MLSSVRPLLLPVVFLALLTSCSDESGKAAAKAPLMVRTEIAKPTTFTPTHRLGGIIRARDSHDASFRVSGTMSVRAVKLGQKVTAGTLLAEIDPIDQQQDLLAARASFDAAQAAARLAQSEYERRKALVDKGVITRAAFEQAEQDLKVKRANVDRVSAQVGFAEENLANTKLLAGVEGTITAVHAEKGQLVQIGQPIVTIAADNGLQAVFDISESLLQDSAHQAIRIALLDDPEVQAEARLAELSPTVNRATGTIRIKTDIIEPPAEMRLGLSIVGHAAGLPRAGFMLPASALASDNGAPAVWVVDQASRKVERHVVTIGEYTGERILITAGIAAGDEVVSEGVKFLSPGQIVKAVPGA